MSSFNLIFRHWKQDHILAPGALYAVDRSVFKKSDKEKKLLASMKSANKWDRIAEFGKDANKYLNCSARQISGTRIS